MKQTIFFDLDDTLIHCNKYFFQVIEQFVESMRDWFAGYEEVTPDAVRNKQIEIDIAGVSVFGFKSDHFPQSFVETYIYYSDLLGRKRSDKEIDYLWKIGRDVYNHDTEPYPHMEHTLDSLADAGHELHLYTGGEVLIQRRKIDKMSLDRYFGPRIYIRQHKNNEALEQILSDGGFNRKHTWMIGNSIRTDVVPALTAGIHAIHMKAATEWEYNNIGIDVQPKGAFFRLNTLNEVPPAIHGYISK